MSKKFKYFTINSVRWNHFSYNKNSHSLGFPKAYCTIIGSLISINYFARNNQSNLLYVCFLSLEIYDFQKSKFVGVKINKNIKTGPAKIKFT